jgi:DNA replication protein DnaC
MTENGPIEGYIWRCDKAAFLARNPDAQPTGSQQCDCVSGKCVERLYAYAGLPPHREHCTFEYFDGLPARARMGKIEARRLSGQMATYGYVDGKVHLLLRGDTGQGKSSLAACIVRERIAAGVTSLWIDLNDFLAEVYKAQQRMFARERGEDDAPDNPFEFVDKVANVPFLVIDDFGDMLRGKAVTDYQRDRVYNVVRARYEKELPCVITTNLTVDQMVAQFGKRIADRIVESWFWSDMTGESLRVQ